MEVRLLPPAFSLVHNNTYTVVVLYWFRSLAVNQAHVGSIPIDHPFTLEDIRPDEETVLNTAGVNSASGFESLVFRLFELHSPVAKRQRQLAYIQSIDSSSLSRTTWLLALIRLVRGVSAKHADSEFESR